jgi:hypothetical protein
VCLFLNITFLLQGLILSNALRAQKNGEDEGCTMALNNLRSEVIELRNEGLEKDKILHSLLKKQDKAASKAQAEAQKCKIKNLQKQLAEANLRCATTEANLEVSDYWKNHWEKTAVELRSSKAKCYEKSMKCVETIKSSFTSVGAFFNESNFVLGDPEGPIDWINGEPEAIEEILGGRGDICAFSGARGMATILERRGCDHVKSLAQTEAALTIEDVKDPSAEAVGVLGPTAHLGLPLEVFLGVGQCRRL